MKDVVQSTVDDKQFLKLKRWEDIKVSFMATSFPLLKIAEVEELSLGVFEIKQASPNISTSNEQLQIWIWTERKNECLWSQLKANTQTEKCRRRLLLVIVQLFSRVGLSMCKRESASRLLQ